MNQTESILELDKHYSINLVAKIQFKTDNINRRRQIKRVEFGWFWNDDGIWKPYSIEHTLAIEEAYLDRRPQVSIKIGSSDYDINLVEMCQFHGMDRFRRRTIQRRGAPLKNKQHGYVLGKESFVVADTYPPYWKNVSEELIELEVPPSDDNFKQIFYIMNNTIALHDNRYGLVPGYGVDPKYFEITKIVCVQNPDLWK